MNRFRHIFLFLLILYTACSSVKVTNVYDQATAENHALLYTLPKTAFKVEVELVSTTITPGPYCQFAEKFLSLVNVPTTESTSWSISSVNVRSYPTPDKDHYYRIETKGNSPAQNISLTPDGFLIGINVNEDYLPNTPQAYIQGQNKLPDPYLFTDFSVKNNFKEVKKMTYREEKTDTTFKKVPVYLSSSQRKTLEEKAEEAANFIIKIRKNRFKLSAGAAETKIPKGIGVGDMLEKLDSIEHEYVKLFTGVVQSGYTSRTFDYLPEANAENVEYPLFYFSATKGVVTKETIGAKPVFLKMNRSGNVLSIVAMQIKQEKLKTEPKGLVYRIPEWTDLKLSFEENLLYQQGFLVCQFGTTNVIPPSMVTKDASIEFHPEFGSLKSIKKISK